MMRSRLRALLFALLCCLVGTAGAAVPVLLVTSESGGAYDETVAAIRGSLLPDLPAADVATMDWREFAAEALDGNRIVVTIGTQAAQAVAGRGPRQPVLHTLVSRETFERLPMPRGAGRASAIFLDQPVQRQIAVLQEALPEWQQLALIAGPRSQTMAAQLAAAARERQLRVTVDNAATDRDLYPALQRVLAEPAVLVALPDNIVFNSYTIQNVLLTAYRHRSPVMGFSPAYVRAGALLALYSTPAQIGEQAADAVRALLAGGTLPAPQAARKFEIGINQNVARSLGIRLDSAQLITARVARREQEP